MAEILNPLLHYAVKVVLSGVLLFVIVLCIALTVRLWSERTVVFSPFEHLSETEASAAKGQYFTQLVSEHLRELHAVYTGQPTGRASDETPLFPSTDQIGRGLDITFPSLQGSPLSAINIQAYGIHVSTLLADLWRWIERPPAIEGKLWEGAGGLRVTASLSQPAGGAQVRWQLEEVDVETASGELACRILHMLLASPAQPAFNDTTTLDFCVFTRAWRAYQRYRSELFAGGSTEESEAALKRAEDAIETLMTRQSPFPFMPKLAALIQQERGRPEAARKLLDEYRQRLAKYRLTDDRLDELYERVAGIPGDAALGHRGVTRPLRPGVSVGSEAVTAGTLCCFVRDSQGRNYILSADHVFAGEEGAAVLQPGPFDGGRARDDQVATLAQIRRAQPDVDNQVAGAIAELLPNIGFVQEVAGIGPITVVADRVGIGDRLRAVGRTSGLVEGQVQGMNLSIMINIGGGESRRYEGMILASPMSAGGDSGAPVFNERDELVGMVYAGSPTNTFVMPLAPVLEAFGVELAVD